MSLQDANQGLKATTSTAIAAIFALAVVAIVACLTGVGETLLTVIIVAIAGLGGYSVGALHIYSQARDALAPKWPRPECPPEEKKD